MKILLIALILLVAGGYGGSKFYLHHKVSKSVDGVFAALSPYATIGYGGVSSTLGGELTVDDVYLQPAGFRDEIRIGRMGITTPSYLALLKLTDLASSAQQGSPALPEYLGLIAKNIRIPANADYYRQLYDANIEAIAPADIGQRGVQCVGKYGHSPKALRALGYEELVISVSTILRQDEKSYTTIVDLGVTDMLDARVETTLLGSVMSAAIRGAAYDPQLTNMRIEVTDRSLNQRIQQYCTELGLTPEQIQRAHLDSLEYFGSKFGIEFDEYVIEPYKEFIAGKPTLIATAKPRRPLHLSRIDNYRPGDVPALLNLEAVAQ